MPRKNNARKQRANREMVVESSVESLSVKAVLVGINYIGTRNQLGGCINDVVKTRANILSEYPSAIITLMTDNTAIQPTRNNILIELERLIKDAKDGDTLIFHYSGHGSQVEDLNGDEEDGMDETICPIDYADPRVIIIDGIQHNVDSQILDDEIHDIIENVPKGARFLMLSDSCHSGTIGDLKNDFKHYNPIVGSRSIYDKDTGNHVHFDYSMNKTRILNMRVPNSNSGGELRIISGCEEDQTSADTGINGACTKAFWDTIQDFGGFRKFLPIVFSHNVQDLKSIQDAINKRLSNFGFTQQSVVSWEDASPELAHEEPTAQQSTAVELIAATVPPLQTTMQTIEQPHYSHYMPAYSASHHSDYQPFYSSPYSQSYMYYAVPGRPSFYYR